MRRLLPLLLSGCSALLGIDEVVLGRPDAPLSCLVDPSYAPAPAVDGDPGVSVTFDPADRSYFFALKLNSSPESDILGLWLRPGFGVFATNPLTEGAYAIAGNDAKPGDCGLCVFIAANYDVKAGTASDFYMASAGDVNLNDLHGRFKVSLRNLTFSHVDINTGALQDACATTIAAASADLALSSGGMPDARLAQPDAGPPDSPPSDAGTITGSVIDTYVNAADAGVTPAPIDLSAVAIEAYTPSGTGFTKTTGSGTKAGLLTIPNVPGGPRIVRVSNQYLATTASQVDFGEIRVGRPDYQTVDDGSNVFHIDVTGADPAGVDGDFYELYSAGVNSFTDECQVDSADPTNLHCDVSSFNRVVDKTKGDLVVLTELASQTTGGGEDYRALTRAVVLPAFSTSATGPVTVPTVAFAAPIAQTSTATIDWRLQGFHAAKTFVNPNATFQDDSLYLFTLPAGNKVSLFGSDAPDLFQAGRGDESLDEVNFGAVHFGNPFPAAWSVWAYHYTTFTVDLTAPGASSAVTMNSFLVRVAPVTALSPFAITLTPVLGAQINGRNADTDQTGVGVTPLLTWNAPGTGAPTGYYIDIYELSKGVSNDSNEAFIATVYTSSRIVRIPPGILTTGKTYFAYITAFIAPNASFSQAPYRRGMPYALADHLTAPFSP
jgi:hypothetical protein